MCLIAGNRYIDATQDPQAFSVLVRFSSRLAAQTVLRKEQLATIDETANINADRGGRDARAAHFERTPWKAPFVWLGSQDRQVEREVAHL